jgi:hypothetical protein
MFVSKTSIPRRRVLKGMGVALALPLLDAMVPAMTPIVKTPPHRDDGSGASTSRTARSWIDGHRRPRAPVSSSPRSCSRSSRSAIHLNIVTNLTRPEQGVDTNHAGAPASWLAGVPPKRTRWPRLLAGQDARSSGREGDRAGDDVPVARARDRGLQRVDRRLRSRDSAAPT